MNNINPLPIDFIMCDVVKECYTYSYDHDIANISCIRWSKYQSIDGPFVNTVFHPDKFIDFL